MRALLRTAALLLLTLALVRSAPGSAQSAQRFVPLQLLQARSCYAEVATHLDACAAIVFVHKKRAELRRMPERTMVRLYSQPMRSRTGPRRWVHLLRAEGRAPGGWPSRYSWRQTQNRFRPVYEHVGKIMRGEVEDPCPEALHYGGPQWLDGDAPTGFELDPACELAGTEQRFFRRSPRRVPRQRRPEPATTAPPQPELGES
ncbi:MAG: hypothetical protein AAGH15_06395 [Myxococcota bacterium]